MGSLNRAQLIGNLGRDAELKYTPGGVAVASVSLATNEQWKDKDGKAQDRTTWHRVVLWGKQAESIAEYLTKGKQIYVEGRIEHNEWTDKEGVKRLTPQIRADRVVFLSGGGKSGSGSYAPHPADTVNDAPTQAPQTVPDDDDIPFSFLLPFVLPLTGMVAAGLSVWA